MKLTDHSVHDILVAFRSSDPTPGGGSASALSGAVGASLLAMVATLPKPAAVTIEELERLHAAGAQCAELARRLEELIDRDSEAYNRVVAAYRLPKASDEEKSTRAAKIQAALRVAIEAPLDVMRACSSAIEQAPVIARLGNTNASSDVEVGLELLRAGLKGAQLNVEINLGSVKGQEFADSVRRDIASFQSPMSNFQK